MKAVPFGAYVQSRRRNVQDLELAPAPCDVIELPPPPDLETIREEAGKAGFDAGYAAAAAEYELRLASQQTLLIEQVEAARKQTLAREAGAYKRLVARELGKIRTELEAQIAPVLKCLFAGAIEQRAHRETLVTLSELLNLRKLGDIRIAGPEKYLDALREGLGPVAQAVEFTPADQPDVSISFGQTSIRTQIGTWKEKLEELSGVDAHV